MSGVETVDEGLMLFVHPSLPIVLRASRAQDEHMRALFEPRFFDRVGRYYLALAVAYVALVMALVVFALVFEA